MARPCIKYYQPFTPHKENGELANGGSTSGMKENLNFSFLKWEIFLSASEGARTEKKGKTGEASR